MGMQLWKTWMMMMMMMMINRAWGRIRVNIKDSVTASLGQSSWTSTLPCTTFSGCKRWCATKSNV